MKFVLICALTFIFAAQVIVADKTIINRLGQIDVNTILENEWLLNNLLKCLIEGKRCTKDGTEIKKFLPEAIRTGCAKCTDSQRTGGIKVIKHLIKEKPNEWKILLDKFDPQKVYRARWNPVLAKDGLNID
ncbi:hypothetical protein HHI36_003591 [Cryptolaemus montrouzieri]|uniref:Chemosensory protein n=1 Tax=Cryptolaemus montrouzieri TaxID=559131 RepID=A0ABD2PE04_9CUCU